MTSVTDIGENQETMNENTPSPKSILKATPARCAGRVGSEFVGGDVWYSALLSQARFCSRKESSAKMRDVNIPGTINL